eukprot:Gb_28174 [translate_table: standard]
MIPKHRNKRRQWHVSGRFTSPAHQSDSRAGGENFPGASRMLHSYINTRAGRELRSIYEFSLRYLQTKQPSFGGSEEVVKEMDSKQGLVSALSVGLGLGLGLGLATGRSQTFQKWTSLGLSVNFLELMEQELALLVIDGKSSSVTFEEFPYYLSEQTKALLTSATFMHLKQAQFTKYTRNLTPASRAILLSGPAEPYHQMLAKALAHFFEAKLLLLDATDFSLKSLKVNFYLSLSANLIAEYAHLQLQRKYGGSTDSDSKSLSGSALERMSSLLESFSILPARSEPNICKSGTFWRQSSGVESKARSSEGTSNLQNSRSSSASEPDLTRLASATTNSANQTSLKRANSWAFDDKLLVRALHKVLVSVSRTSPVVLYLRNAERLMFRGPQTYSLFCKMIKQLSGPIVILGSRMLDSSDKHNHGEIDEKMALLFPYNIEINPPEDDTQHVSWKSKLEEDIKAIQFQDNRNHVSEAEAGTCEPRVPTVVHDHHLMFLFTFQQVLAANDVECDDLGSVCFGDAVVLSNYIEEIVVSAISYHLMNTEEPNYRGGRLVISSKSLAHGLSVFRAGQLESEDTLQMESTGEHSKDPQESTSGKVEAKAETPGSEIKSEGEKTDSKGDTPKKDSDNAKEGNASAAPPKPEVAPDNDFEKRIRPEVIPAGKIGVTFADIGALENVKESLQELVMLPLQRPDLFKGGLLKPCRGILLFGPPGTGKTMLAKALATEASASFINVSMSTITSKWFGEDEKNVRALFSLASKVSPTVIFIDEVDSMLGQRSRVGEHEAMRKIKNEFMAHWDGLLSKAGERVLVLAATNRPFDLDEAIIRRFERRIMVGLPTAENREKILRTLLAKENLEEGFDFKELATMTEGYTGSDLKNICTTAAFRPVRELLKKEREKEKVGPPSFGSYFSSEQKLRNLERILTFSAPLQAKKENLETAQGEKGESDSSQQPDASSEDKTETKEDKKEEADETVIALRPITMEDMKQAKSQISPSFASEGAGMNELKEWNELYGEGGSRKKQRGWMTALFLIALLFLLDGSKPSRHGRIAPLAISKDDIDKLVLIVALYLPIMEEETKQGYMGRIPPEKAMQLALYLGCLVVICTYSFASHLMMNIDVCLYTNVAMGNPIVAGFFVPALAGRTLNYFNL